MASDAVKEYLKSHGNQPRHRANRLMFVAADQAVLNRLEDVTRVALAWASIVEDVSDGRLNIDQVQSRQAKKESDAAAAVIPRAARECFKWLLCPVQDDPGASSPTVEAFPLNTTSGTVSSEMERICHENELVIETWSPIHLRTKLRELYWRGEKKAVPAAAFWEDSLRYLYLPRLKSREVLAAAVRTGASSRDFFGTAYGQADGKFDGFQFGQGSVSFDDTLLLIEPEYATAYENAHRPAAVPSDSSSGVSIGMSTGATVPPSPTPTTGTASAGAAKSHSFHATADVSPTAAKMRLVQIAEEVISLLASDANANVRVTLEVSADFPSGASDQIKRAVNENCTSLGITSKSWE